MKYIEIESQIKELSDSYREASKKVRVINSKLSELRRMQEQKESELLIEFLGINSTIEFENYRSLSGVQTNIKKTPVSEFNNNTNIFSPTFRKGDVVKIVKLNKKSVVIECIKKMVIDRKVTPNIEKSINPQSQFRIDLENFKNSILSDSNYRNRFITWVKRKESLEQLLEK